MKLLRYKSEKDKVTLYFENNQKAIIWRFGLTSYSVVSDLLSKSGLVEIKQYLLDNGFEVSLDSFLGREFKTINYGK